MWSGFGPFAAHPTDSLVRTPYPASGMKIGWCQAGLAVAVLSRLAACKNSSDRGSDATLSLRGQWRKLVRLRRDANHGWTSACNRNVASPFTVVWRIREHRRSCRVAVSPSRPRRRMWPLWLPARLLGASSHHPDDLWDKFRPAQLRSDRAAFLSGTGAALPTLCFRGHWAGRTVRATLPTLTAWISPPECQDRILSESGSRAGRPCFASVPCSAWQ